MPQHDTSSTERRDEQPVQFVLVSGFLGAGKTTSLQTIGETLTQRGYTVGMITNDQASGLVDTSILSTGGGQVEEIPGGCFCCNFEDLVEAAHSVLTRDVDVILCEPVGSCTDLVATVINPLRSMYAAEFSVAPLTAIVDPARVRSFLREDAGGLPEEVWYIFRQQLDEADLVVLNKSDTLDDDEQARLVSELQERVGDRPVIPVSAKQRDGVEEWLSKVVDTPGSRTRTESGRALTDIDYDIYAEGEARLGWVNMTVTLDGPFDAAGYLQELMGRVQQQIRETGIEVAHLKCSITADGSVAHANLTSSDSDPEYSGADLGTIDAGRLLLNARAVGDPEEIRTIASDAISGTSAAATAEARVDEVQSFRPAYPEPVYRMEGGPDTSESTQSG